MRTEQPGSAQRADERRWYEMPWAGVTGLLLMCGLLFLWLQWMWEDVLFAGALCAGGAVAGLVVGVVLRRKAVRQARELGLEPKDLPPLARRIKREETPEDETDRQRMLWLLEKQFRPFTLNPRWLWLGLAGLYALLLLSMLFLGDDGRQAPLWGFLLVLSVWNHFHFRRMRALHDRMLPRLQPVTGQHQ
ncbi:hypothetical protein [Streptomyces sp. NPDC051561]|uniref:hypothetical protein n=1 Tax=Streptomyces sp. NPDC051561 TaxID=3365658 RepID=UPI0037AF6B98